MSNDLTMIRARRAAIAEEDAELAVAERVLMRIAEGSLGAGIPDAGGAKAGRKPPSIEGGQLGLAQTVLPQDGSRMHKVGFRRALEDKRGTELSDGALSTLLSRLSTAGVIRREGDYISLVVAQTAEGGADVIGNE